VVYKNCHRGRQDVPRAEAWEFDKHLQERIASGECLHLGPTVGTICGKPAIGSHTVSKAMLKWIARDGHVYQHSATVQSLEKTHGQLTVRPIGVNDASVLRVFCKSHDGPAFHRWNRPGLREARNNASCSVTARSATRCSIR
jgi:hypothetical protein